MHKTVTALIFYYALTFVLKGESLSVDLRYRYQNDKEFNLRVSKESWDTKKTAVIVCDMWDSHHCYNAVKRVEQLAPEIDKFVSEMRRKGAVIIHAPSSCMEHYKDHPSRIRSLNTKKSKNLPKDINKWLHWINAEEEQAGYPIDHSDGGEDDTPEEHLEWEKKLKSMGRNPRSPWLRQIGSININEGNDYITDSGEENWNILESNSIKNVMIVGVHTNMCVLGRPFGLRQLAKNGMNVVLVRDLTDTMYNPKMEPKVSHFVGTDLIVNHIEKYVCPTVVSSQVTGDKAFKFKNDHRKKILFLIGEREYSTELTLPFFAEEHLSSKYKLEFLFADDNDNDFGDIENSLIDADLLFVSVRRRSLKAPDMASIKHFIKSGKPVLGIRTSSHAFSLRGKPPPKGELVWEEFDQQVFGGNYSNHYGNELTAFGMINDVDHYIIDGVNPKAFVTGGSLYKVLPLKKSTKVIVDGYTSKKEVKQPLAWINENDFGGKSFYTSLGHVDDFKNINFINILKNAVDWLINDKATKIKKLSFKKKPLHEQVHGALSPDGSHSLLEVSEDLQIDLMLSEPLVAQPLHLSFDYKGRLWVVQYTQYPDPAGLKRLSRDKVWRVAYDKFPPPPPHALDSPFRGTDKITIHEDTDNDGMFDNHKVFVDGLNMATSVAHDANGVWVTNPPYLIYYKDANSDDIPDGKPEVHLTGFGLEDSHSIANSLVVGADGWIYGAQGSTISASIIENMSDVRSTPTKSMGQNIWRYSPRKKKYEIYAEGGGNAFGLELDSRGRIYSGHNGGDTRGFHYVKGSYYQKNWGKHGSLTNQYAFGFFPAMRNAQVERFTHQFIIYEDKSLPKRFHGKLLGVDVLHNNVVMSEITPDGSTFKTKDLERFITSKDPWFRPVMIADSPDGSVFIADWYDQQVNHYRNHEGNIDKKLGRIYRVSKKGITSKKKFNLRTCDELNLIEFLSSDSRWLRRMALIELKSRDSFKLESINWKDNPQNISQFEFINAANHYLDIEKIDDPGVRGYAIRSIAERPDSHKFYEKINKIAISEKNPEVISQLISSIMLFHNSMKIQLVEKLLLRSEFVNDPFIPLQLWWAIESIVSYDDNFVRVLFSDPETWNSKLIRKHIIERLIRRYSEEGDFNSYSMCEFLLRNAPDENYKNSLINGFLIGQKGNGYGSLPNGLIKIFEENKKQLPVDLRIIIQDESVIDEAIARINNNKLKESEVVSILSSLSLIKNKKVFEFLKTYLERISSDNIEVVLLASLTNYAAEKDVQNIAFNKLSSKYESVRNEALDLLMSDVDASHFLIQKVDDSEFEFPFRNQALVEKLKVHDSALINAFLEKAKYKDIEGLTPALEAEIARVKSIITSGGGNPKKGEVVFKNRCIGCHKMFNNGGQIGPDLTSYQKNDHDTLLISVIAPGAEIREGYENIILKIDDGLIFSGFLLEETKNNLVIKQLNGITKVFPKNKIVSTTKTGASLMPMGLLNDLSNDQIIDLFAYLRSTTPPY